MCLLLETIRIEDGIPFSLEYHQRRVNRSRESLFGTSDILSLVTSIDSLQDMPRKGVYKCRILYDKVIRSIEIKPYQIKPVLSLRIVHDDWIEYPFKFEDRQNLERLYESRQGCDDILIIKDGCVTDTSYSNIVFYDGNCWLTPTEPLLKGTCRERLLQEKIIFEEMIKENDLRRFVKASLINAMLDLGTVEIPVKKIYS